MIEIFQSYPSADFKHWVSKVARPIDYSSLPQGSEYDLFKHVFDFGLAGDKPWGLVSWKFRLKSSIELQNFFEFSARELEAGADCVFINPMIANEAIFSNVWEQWVFTGPPIVRNLYSYLADNKLMKCPPVMDCLTFSFCNYFVANSNFWIRYFFYVDSILAAIEDEVLKNSPIGNVYKSSAGYPKNLNLSTKPFIIERLFSTFISENKDLDVRNYLYSQDMYTNKLGGVMGLFCKEMSDLKGLALKDNDSHALAEWQARRVNLLNDREQLFTLLNADDPSIIFANKRL